MSWNDERITVLKKMWQQGKSASEIAEKLGGVTRNAVIGKAHRLGLSGRPSPISSKAFLPKKQTAKPVAPAKKPEIIKKNTVTSVAPKPSAAPPKKAANLSVAPVVNAKAEAAKALAKSSAKPAVQPPSKNAPGKPPEPVILAALANQTTRSDGMVVSILDLKERMCRWPVGDPNEPGFGYCGSDSIAGHPYCADHVAIAFQAPNRKDGKKPKDIKLAEAVELDDLEIEVDTDEVDEDEELADDLDADDDENPLA